VVWPLILGDITTSTWFDGVTPWRPPFHVILGGTCHLLGPHMLWNLHIFVGATCIGVIEGSTIIFYLFSYMCCFGVWFYCYIDRLSHFWRVPKMPYRALLLRCPLKDITLVTFPLMRASTYRDFLLSLLPFWGHLILEDSLHPCPCILRSYMSITWEATRSTWRIHCTLFFGPLMGHFAWRYYVCYFW
jgi:hypothetical protein